MRNISSKTRLLGVIGDPIAHSLSPKIHNMLYAEQKIDAIYLPALVQKDRLGDFIKNLPTFNWLGFNATMPHKKFLIDHAEVEAKHRKGVNTVRLRPDGSMIATSTDAAGFMDSLHYEEISLAGKHVLILGAGAVVHSVGQMILDNGAASLTLANRTEKNARALAENLSHPSQNVRVIPLTTPALKDACLECDLLINATPMGLSGYPHDFEDLSFLSAMTRHAVVVDLNYSPAITTLMREAHRRGLQTLNGLGMLVGQALRAHEFWFDIPPTQEMFNKTLKLLSE